MEMVYQIFVYGSLRSGFPGNAYQYISKYFTLLGNAKVKGKLYDLGEYPAALPDDKDCFIVGELYTITNKDEFSWAMAQLDDYEGLNVESGETPLYRRELADVYLHETVVKAWIYWYNNAITDKQLISSGDVLEYFQQKMI
jgi:gamma-glutamylcyclotransferase (GGCT)/AIG2-like uncharacterized protein YtfP